MIIPHHWAKATAEGTDRKGKKLEFSCWRWSDKNIHEAKEKALAAAHRILDRFIRGEKPKRYLYGEQPLREEILEEFHDALGNQIAVITRNSYGCMVLN